jgi:hypothetical protein
VTESVSIDEVGSNDLVIISQPYTDHCHKQTLLALHPYKKMMAVKPAKKRIEKEIKDIAPITEISDITKGWTSYGALQVADFLPDKWIDPIYHALALRMGDEVIFYSPHGFELDEQQLASLKGLRIKLLITTFSYFKIPAILGGLVNTGLEGVSSLSAQLKPERIVNTHDEQKKGRGLVLRLAKTVYADMLAEEQKDKRVIAMEDYNKVSIS